MSGDKPLGWTGFGLTMAFCMPLFPLFGAGASLVALVRGRFQPRWIAVLSLVLGLLFTAGQAALGVALVDSVKDEVNDSTTGTDADRPVMADDVTVGDCFNDPVLRGLKPDEPGKALGELEVLPCTEPHDFEVYGAFEVKGDGAFPGEKAMIKKTDRCLPLFRKYVGVPYRKSTYEGFSYYPSADSWVLADRTITCILANPELKPLKRSAKNTKR
ncbi:septum formation family protein [Nocardioides sp. WS12]|uniref:septum formation family protein n=1 Tax=Nocardioides sp. WS12 TaxID=2486272 RepID=UPI0015FC6D16|nr:septum formation family protein [Nocardioides sp. WS12]